MDHWGDLASEIGATPSSEDTGKRAKEALDAGKPTEEPEPVFKPAEESATSEPMAEEPVTEEPVQAESSAERVPPRPERSKEPPTDGSGWDDLATELGIEPSVPESGAVERKTGSDAVDEQEPTPAPSARKVRAKRGPGKREQGAEVAELPSHSVDEAPAPEAPSRGGDLQDTFASGLDDKPEVKSNAEVGPPAVLNGFGAGLFDSTEPVVEAAGPVEPSVEEGETPAKKKAVRRRRRRRRKVKSAPVAPTADEELESVEVTEDLPEFEAVVSEDYEAVDEIAAEDQDQPRQEADERRPRRRRRRGETRKGRSSRADHEKEDLDQEPASSEEPILESEEDGELAPTKKKRGRRRRVKQEAEETHTEDPAKPSHRNIPTWEEAIGHVVAANMESRGKSAGAARGRGKSRSGGRRSKDSHGSRGRASKK